MKPIAIPRPTDPELRRQWDEAKRACEAREQRQLSRALELAAELTADPSCCVGDRSQCHCAPERGGWSDDDVEREKWARQCGISRRMTDE